MKILQKMYGNIYHQQILLEKVENIDLEDIEKINLIEKAVHDGNYNEE